MNYGLQMSAAGALVAMHRQDVISANLANMDTVGFKADFANVMQRDPVRKEDSLPNLPSDDMLERLTGGLFAAPTTTSFSQGGLRETRGDLDVAIRGEGFLAVRDERVSGPDSTRLTRDGRLSRDARGRLVTATTGLPVLSTSGQPIVLDGKGKIGIGPDGLVTQDGNVVGRIRIADVADRSILRKSGDGLFALTQQQYNAARNGTGELRQGFVEDSTVDEVRALMQFTNVSRDVESNVSMIEQQDRMLERAINSFGRLT